MTCFDVKYYWVRMKRNISWWSYQLIDILSSNIPVNCVNRRIYWIYFRTILRKIFLTIATVPAKQPWWIWINTSCEFIMNDCITTTKQSTTKPCAYFLGYTVILARNIVNVHLCRASMKYILSIWTLACNSVIPSTYVSCTRNHLSSDVHAIYTTHNMSIVCMFI